MKKSAKDEIEIVATCDLDVGGVCKNIKKGDVLPPRIVKKLKSETLDRKGKLSWYENLIGQGVIKEQKPKAEPTEKQA